MSSLIKSLTARLLRGEVWPAVDAQRRAAVAVVLHDERALRVLLMKRVGRAGDPWSGTSRLPGGGYQASDGDLRVTAIRETREALGVELDGARWATSRRSTANLGARRGLGHAVRVPVVGPPQPVCGAAVAAPR